MEIQKFTFGPFGENTYVLVDKESKEAIVIDPGMYDNSERQRFKSYLESEGIIPKLLVNTHCHIDHVMGNAFVHEEYGLTPQMHENGSIVLAQAARSAEVYGLNYDHSPAGEASLKDGEELQFGSHSFKILFTPGHAPDHIVLYNAEDGYVIGGDVLFNGSVGRVDLPGSVPSDLVKSIQKKMYTLPDDTVVYCGHGPETTIGKEKKSNPFVSEHSSSLG